MRDIREWARRAREQPPIPPRSLNPALGRELNAVMLKALQKAPEDRYQSVSDFVRDIQNVQQAAARGRAAEYHGLPDAEVVAGGIGPVQRWPGPLGW